MATARKSRVLRAIPLLVAVCLINLPAHAKYGGGTGMHNDPYLIFTAEQMNEIGINLDVDSDRHFQLMADIDLSSYTGTDFNIIGTDRDNPFTGVFDGNGHTISNFSYTTTNTGLIGLFGVVSSGEVKDVILMGAKIYAGAAENVGSLVGMLVFSTVSGCSVQDATVIGGTIVGGLVGDNGGTITNCYSSCIVDGNSVGGLIGINAGGIISSCYSTGTVSGNSPVGGLVGQNGTWIHGMGEMLSMDGYIDRCYSTCSVTGMVAVGGLVGFNDTGIITQCYSSGGVSGKELIGGLIGDGNARVTFCFWDVETSGLTISAGGVGKTTAEMQSAETFLGWGACGPLWTVDEGHDYPHLAWENMFGEFITGPTFGGGAGTAEEPYLIYTAEQLNTIGLSFCDWDKHFKLMADIDLSAFDGKDGRPAFNVIGLYRWDAFTGVFDGNDHTISHLTLTGEDNLGMFGYLESGAEVRDLGIVDVNINGFGSFVGALAGYSRGDVTRCYSSGTVRGDWSVGGLVGASLGYLGTYTKGAVTQCHSTCVVSGNDWLGGLVGSNGGVINQCYSTGGISGRRRVGGLVGDNGFGTVSKCYSTGDVSGDSGVGGLLGFNDSWGNVTHSYSTGSVNGRLDIGGLVGYNRNIITSCYSTVSASGDSKVGGLVGHNYHGSIAMSYSTGAVSGNERVGGLVGDHSGNITSSFWDMEASGLDTSAGGTGKTTAEMQTVGTFLEAGWDFVDETANGTEDIWWILEGQDYPRLWWEAHD